MKQFWCWRVTCSMPKVGDTCTSLYSTPACGLGCYSSSSGGTGWPFSSHYQIPRLFPDFFRHFKWIFTEYRPSQQQRYKTKCMLFLTAILIYTVITMTSVFFSRLQWNNSLFLFGCTKAIIFCAKNNIRGNRRHASSSLGAEAITSCRLS